MSRFERIVRTGRTIGTVCMALAALMIVTDVGLDVWAVPLLITAAAVVGVTTLADELLLSRQLRAISRDHALALKADREQHYRRQLAIDPGDPS